MGLFNRNKEKTTTEISYVRLNEIVRLLNKAIDDASEAYGDLAKQSIVMRPGDKHYDEVRVAMGNISSDIWYIRYALDHLQYVIDDKGD